MGRSTAAVCPPSSNGLQSSEELLGCLIARPGSEERVHAGLRVLRDGRRHEVGRVRGGYFCARRSGLRCSTAHVALAARCWPLSPTGRKSTRSCASAALSQVFARRRCPGATAPARRNSPSTCRQCPARAATLRYACLSSPSPPDWRPTVSRRPSLARSPMRSHARGGTSALPGATATRAHQPLDLPPANRVPCSQPAPQQ